MSVKLNVLLVCYNASEYIEECVNSILMQKTDFPFNVIAADDCSTDDTLDKIKRLSENSHIEFIFLQSEKNLGLRLNYKRGFSACDAEYIAVMEGDDFWNDPNRLQKHIDFLDNHYECAMSSNSRFHFDYEKAEFTRLYAPPPSENTSDYFLATAQDIVRHEYSSNFSTCVYRHKNILKLPSDWFDHPDLTFNEVATNAMVCLHGFLGFLWEPMTVRTIHTSALFGSKSYEEKLEIFAKQVSYSTDLLTNKRFEKEIDKRRNWALGELKKSKGESDSQQTLEALYQSLINSRSWKITKPLRCAAGFLRKNKI